MGGGIFHSIIDIQIFHKYNIDCDLSIGDTEVSWNMRFVQLGSFLCVKIIPYGLPPSEWFCDKHYRRFVCP